MLEPAVLVQAARSQAVTVSLIGDLDGELAAILTETLAELIRRGEREVIVTFDHIASSTPEGLQETAKALARARCEGTGVGVATRNRLVRGYLKLARIPIVKDRTAIAGTRYVLIARHSER